MWSLTVSGKPPHRGGLRELGGGGLDQTVDAIGLAIVVFTVRPVIFLLILFVVDILISDIISATVFFKFPDNYRKLSAVLALLG